MTTFYIPHKIRQNYGSIIYEDELVDLKARGLDGKCAENQNGVVTGEQHSWLLLPQQAGQKQYLLCLNCGERSHL